jgi:hypothetical protein
MHNAFIYVKNKNDDKIFICLYVDDLSIMAKDVFIINQIKDKLKLHFKMKDLGLVKYILGMEVNSSIK